MCTLYILVPSLIYRRFFYVKTMAIDLRCKPMCTDDTSIMCSTQHGIGISNTSVESISQWAEHFWSCDGRRITYTGLTFWVILLGISQYKNDLQDPHHWLLWPVDESNLIKISSRTRHGLQKPSANFIASVDLCSVCDVILPSMQGTLDLSFSV